MKKIFFLVALLSTVQANVKAQSKLDQDRVAIRALGGFYKVTFDYAETFSPDTAYHNHPQYHSWGYEWAAVEEDSPKKIVIQHLLVVGDSAVIKHWREDWVYEEPALLNFDQNSTWKKGTLKTTEAKGRWVQKVFQVDDSPRYESIGTWIHADGKHFWQSECDSPLPRREFTKRSDYNVLRRGNRIYLTPNGWMFEQDNQKIIRSAGGDKLLAREKGYEEFTKTDEAKFAFAKGWWQKQQPYWTAVRQVWDEVYAQNSVIKLKGKIDGKLLYERLFDLADQSAKEKWDAQKNKAEARKLINNYLDTNV
ncbi:hypothetical protein SAMN05192574_11281 [Mucilaginibacter gossypiicola]|uniref:Uncharacterized protein n=1 Tax=Mucilaginibacter gossypiicola TaxID=551995 RepID=A0A1H8SC69_9SPHI|nr:DUF6607 family protein [Mucilaginibacter gossypiicola]SEO75954.1 hypothetical protein SAMN05192574_11281 [Mucilaginibacter gossypiicola]